MRSVRVRLSRLIGQWLGHTCSEWPKRWTGTGRVLVPAHADTSLRQRYIPDLLDKLMDGRPISAGPDRPARAKLVTNMRKLSQSFLPKRRAFRTPCVTHMSTTIRYPFIGRKNIYYTFMSGHMCHDRLSQGDIYGQTTKNTINSGTSGKDRW